MMVPKAAVHITREDAVGGADELDQQESAEQKQNTRRATRPDNNRSSTEPSPSPSLLLQGYFKDRDDLKDATWPSSSHRNRSPYSRSHLRSRSGGAVANLPLMTRAHSMPSSYTPRPFDNPSSGSLSPVPTASPGMRTPARTRSPFKTDEAKGWTETGGAGIESIQEDSELDIQPRGMPQQLIQPMALHTSRVPSGGRRRPASPLYSLPQQAPTSFPANIMDQGTSIHSGPSPAHSASGSRSSSPSLAPQKYVNEAYPTFQPQHQLQHHSSMSSVNSFSSLNSFSSTPTSARSRSPSISSLDTIEDEPEMEVMESLKEDAEGEEGEERRRSLDAPRPTVGFGFTRGRSERKRWSVCGGERRGDLDLETIWED